jgi:septal ring factor EnvC (AmiA/AmiB activator)
VADERHIIEIILQARDDTAAALGSATANGSKRLQKIPLGRTRRFRKSFNDLSREVSANDVEMSKLQKSIQNTKGITTSTAASIQQLEQASRKLSQAIGNENASRADQLKAQQEYEKALAQANKSITENTNLNRNQAAQLTQNVSALNRLVAATEQLRKVQAELNTAENQAAAARKKLLTTSSSRPRRQRLTAIQNEQVTSGGRKRAIRGEFS